MYNIQQWLTDMRKSMKNRGIRPADVCRHLGVNRSAWTNLAKKIEQDKDVMVSTLNKFEAAINELGGAYGTNRNAKASGLAGERKGFHSF